MHYTYMESAELIKRLRRDGWRLHSTKGSHHHFVHDAKPGRVTVVHPREAIRLGTLRQIIRQAGWDWRDR